MEELQEVDDYSALTGGTYDVSGISEECHPLLKAIGSPCPFLDPHSPLHEDFFHNFVSSSYGEEEFCSADNPYEEAQVPYCNLKNWSTDGDPCFNVCCFWDDCLFSYGNSIGDNGLVKTQDSFHIEEEMDGYVSQYEYAESDVSYDDCPWPGYESWFGYVMEEDSGYNGRQEPNYAYGDGIRFCEGFLGYWPCLVPKHQMAYGV